MGRDKALLPLPDDRGKTFVAHLASLLAGYCEQVVLVARDAAQAASYTLPGVRAVTDRTPDVGPLMGLDSGLQAITATHALVTAVDMPFVQPALIEFLLAQVQDDDTLIVPMVAGVPQVLLAVYPRALLPIIEERLRAGERGPRSLLKVAPVRSIEEEQLRRVDPQLRSFVNLNTPDELALYTSSDL